MSLDAVRDKYGYKNISFATWRDPRLSVHPARGGPKTPTVDPESVSQPFIPKYKVRYPVPPPTDDESSEEDGAESGEEQQPTADAPSSAGKLAEVWIS